MWAATASLPPSEVSSRELGCNLCLNIYLKLQGTCVKLSLYSSPTTPPSSISCEGVCEDHVHQTTQGYVKPALPSCRLLSHLLELCVLTSAKACDSLLRWPPFFSAAGLQSEACVGPSLPCPSSLKPTQRCISLFLGQVKEPLGPESLKINGVHVSAWWDEQCMCLHCSADCPYSSNSDLWCY